MLEGNSYLIYYYYVRTQRGKTSCGKLGWRQPRAHKLSVTVIVTATAYKSGLSLTVPSVPIPLPAATVARSGELSDSRSGGRMRDRSQDEVGGNCRQIGILRNCKYRKYPLFRTIPSITNNSIGRT
jgi:hypothetical protein